MKETRLTISPYGKQAILISREEEVNEKLLNWLLCIKENIEKEKQSEIVECITAYNTLLIKYKRPIKNTDKEINGLKSTIKNISLPTAIKSHLFHIPVCYDVKFGLDIEELASEKKMDLNFVAKLHSAPSYLVYFIGFLPGFPYLGGLSEKLFYPRKDNPRKKIRKGAVGIGGTQTGIYPGTSPGGWQIIGHCPVPVFDPHKKSPCLFQPGDRIKFYPISVKEHHQITEAINAGDFRLKKENYVSEDT